MLDHRLKSRHVRSGLYGGQMLSLLRLMIRSPNFERRKSMTDVVTCGGAPSCWNQSCRAVALCLNRWPHHSLQHVEVRVTIHRPSEPVKEASPVHHTQPSHNLLPMAAFAFSEQMGIARCPHHVIFAIRIMLQCKPFFIRSRAHVQTIPRHE